MKALFLLLFSFCFSAVASQTIPGLMPVDVYLNLESRGFDVQKHFGPNQAEFACTRQTENTTLNATVLGTATSVTRVVATFDNAQQSLARVEGETHLSYIATIPYAGAEPGAAKSWVAANISSGGVAVFGGARFELFATNPMIRVLEITWQGSSKPVDNEPSAPDKKPYQGMAYRDALIWYGEPLIKVNDWAYWPKFKARFEDGLAKEISDTKKN